MALGIASLAGAAGDAEKCLAAKIKAVSKYESCLYKSEAVAVIKAISPDSGKCETKFADTWPKIEEKYGLDCPTSGDATTRHDASATHVEQTVDELKNVAPVCGNDSVEAGEQCDGADLAGETCVTQGFDQGTLACDVDCMFDTSGCASIDCDLRAQTGCDVGQGCYPLGQNALCAGAGSSTEGQSCAFANSCVPGMGCKDVGSGPECVVICDTADMDPGCSVGQTCTSEPDWGADTGYCANP